MKQADTDDTNHNGGDERDQEKGDLQLKSGTRAHRVLYGDDIHAIITVDASSATFSGQNRPKRRGRDKSLPRKTIRRPGR